jgi:hypothetical protein
MIDGGHRKTWALAGDIDMTSEHVTPSARRRLETSSGSERGIVSCDSEDDSERSSEKRSTANMRVYSLLQDTA